MKVVTIKEFGGPEQLVLTEADALLPTAGQALVAVEAAGVGLMDVFARMGQYPGKSEPGFVPGGEIAGEVVSVGEGVDRSWIGRRVFAVVRVGGYAEQALVPVTDLIPVPAALSSVDAVALGLNALVAHFSLDQIHAQAGEDILVRGAGGGVGLMSVLFALQRGAKVTAVSSSPERMKRLLELGAHKVLNRNGDAVPQDAYDVVIDPSGGTEIPAFISALRPNGRYLLSGVAAGFPAPDFGMAILMNFQRSPTLAAFSLDSIGIENVVTAGTTIFEDAAAGKLKGVIERTHKLGDASAAHGALQAGEVFGKVVLTTA